MKDIRRTLAMLFLVGPLISLYSTFVLMNLWNWFATEALHLPEISFWVMYGLVLIVGMLTWKPDDKANEYSLKGLTICVDACVPEDQKQSVSEQLKDQYEGIWMDVGWTVFSRILDVTFTLVLGWAVHRFLL